MDTNSRNIIRVGRVSSVNPANCSARVTFPDKDDMVSAELPVLQICAKDNMAYSLPDIDTQVICIFLPDPSGRGINQGYILGSFYSDTDAPGENGAGIKSIRFEDGSYVRYEGGNMQIHAVGSIDITAGGNITINGANVYIN